VKPTNSEKEPLNTDQLLIRFSDALSDDLNISGALGAIFTWANSLFAALDADKVSVESAEKALKVLHRIDEVLGVIEIREHEDTSEIDDLIRQRTQARNDKNWSLADEIRDKLQALNILIEDTPDGTVWKKG